MWVGYSIPWSTYISTWSLVFQRLSAPVSKPFRSRSSNSGGYDLCLIESCLFLPAACEDTGELVSSPTAGNLVSSPVGNLVSSLQQVALYPPPQQTALKPPLVLCNQNCFPFIHFENPLYFVVRNVILEEALPSICQTWNSCSLETSWYRKLDQGDCPSKCQSSGIITNPYSLYLLLYLFCSYISFWQNRLIEFEGLPDEVYSDWLLPSSAQAPAKFSWAELALSLFPPARARPPAHRAACSE